MTCDWSGHLRPRSDVTRLVHGRGSHMESCLDGGRGTMRHSGPLVVTVLCIGLSTVFVGQSAIAGQPRVEGRSFLAPSFGLARYWSDPTISGDPSTYTYQMSTVAGLTFGRALSDRVEFCLGGEVSFAKKLERYESGIGEVFNEQFRKLEFVGTINTRFRFLTLDRASLHVIAGVWCGRMVVWEHVAIGTTLGLGVRFTISKRFAVFMEADRRDEMEAFDREPLVKGNVAQIRLRIHPELTLLSW